MQKHLKNTFYGENKFYTHKEIVDLFDDVKNCLTEKQQQTIKLYYVEKMSISEIAIMLKVNRSTVSRSLTRGRAEFVKKMQK